MAGGEGPGHSAGDWAGILGICLCLQRKNGTSCEISGYQSGCSSLFSEGTDPDVVSEGGFDRICFRRPEKRKRIWNLYHSRAEIYKNFS